MGSLSNLYISQSFTSLLHLGNDGPVTDLAPGQYTQFQDGLGNSLGISVNTSGDISSSGFIYAANIFPTITTASFNQYTASTNIRLTNLESTTASLNSSVTQLNANTASQQVSINALNVFTASQSTASIVTSINNLNTATASLNTSVSNINTATASLFTSASLALITASFNTGTRNLTFTKGNNTQFSVNIPDISGSTINTGSFATTGSNTFVGINNFSSSVEIIGGLNLYNNGMSLGLPKNMGDPFENIGIFTAYVAGQSASGNELLLTGDSMTGKGVRITNGLSVTGSLRVTQTFTASLQEGYVWVGDSAGRTTTVATASLVTNVNTGSLVTTASFNAYTSSTNSRLNNIESTTASLLVETQNLESFSASALISLSNLNTATASLFTSASLALVTASFDNGTRNLTFTKGDTTTFSVNIPDVSGSGGGNFVTTSSFNAYTQSNDQRVSSLESNSASVNISISALNTFTASQSTASLVTSINNLNQFSASTLISLSNLNSTTQSLNTSVTNLNQATSSLFTSASLAIVTASVNNDDITFTKGDGTQFTIQVATGSFAISASYAETSSYSQFAQDIYLNVKNTTGAQLNKGTVVRIIGATGDNALIATASWTNDANSANTLGFLYENIPNDSFGKVITQGTLLGINTDPTLGYAAGQILYLSSSGQYTNVKPPAPYHEVRLGQVLRAQQINGSMYVLIQNGYELEELHDVDINTGSLANNNLLAYNSASAQWENKTVTQVGATTTASFNAYTQSTDSRLSNIESTTASLNTSVSNLNSFSASTLVSISNLNASSASQQVSINALNVFTASQSTASIVTSIDNLNTFTSSANVRLNNLETFSASALISLSNLNTATASLFTSASLALVTASVNLNTITFTKGDGTTFPITVNTGSGGGGGGAAFPYTGSAQITGSLGITGSLSGFVNDLAIVSNTASMNFNDGNFFTLQLVSGSITHLTATNVRPGQTINLLVKMGTSPTAASTGSLTFSPTFKFAGGFDYTPTTITGSQDLVSFVTFDTTQIFAAQIKNLL